MIARTRAAAAWRVWTVGLASLVAGLVAVPAALAHAALIDTTPAAGQELTRSPGRVSLRFDEAVSPVAGAIRVYDGDARRVDLGDVTKTADDTLSVSLPERLAPDTYTVAWRALSADSHPVRGAFVFSIEVPVGKGVASEVLGDGGSASVDALHTVARFVGLASILLCLGGVVVLTAVVDPHDGRLARLWAAVAACAILVALDAIGLVVLTGLQAAELGLGRVLDADVARDVLGTDFGRVWALRTGLALGLAAFALLVGRRRSRARVAVAVALALAVGLTLPLAGHARVDGALAVLADAVHVLAAGVWVGGLAFLSAVLVVAGGDRWSLAAKVVPRFSTLALASVAALVATGVVGAVLQVGTWSGLWETTYGRLVLVKAGLLVPLVALGAFNNRISTPVLRSGTAGPAARRRFVASVAGELALMVVVVAVTAVLVAEPPARAASPASFATREGTVGPYAYTLTIEPARTGTNEIHVYLLDSSGALAPVDAIGVTGSLPAVDVGPLTFPTTPAGPGHAIATAKVPLAGDWRFEVTAREGEFDEWSTTIEIPIRKDNR